MNDDVREDLRQEMENDVFLGFGDKDLRPLAAYIRSGFAITPSLAKMIADAIEGQPSADYILRLQGRKHRQKTMSEIMDKVDRDTAIGVSVERKLRSAKRGESEGIIAATMEEFGVGRTVVMEALKNVRRALRGDYSDMKVVDLVSLAIAFPEVGSRSDF